MRQAAGCIVVKYDQNTGEKSFLAMRRNNQNGYDFPGGKMEPQESQIDNAVREIYEETGLVVIIDNAANSFSENDGEFNFTVFPAHVVAGNLKPSDEGDVVWVENPYLFLTGSFPRYNYHALLNFGIVQPMPERQLHNYIVNMRKSKGQTEDQILAYRRNMGICQYGGDE